MPEENDVFQLLRIKRLTFQNFEEYFLQRYKLIDVAIAININVHHKKVLIAILIDHPQYMLDYRKAILAALPPQLQVVDDKHTFLLERLQGFGFFS